MDLDHYILHKEYKFDGFIVDLMTELEKELNCTFLLKATEDDKYGSPANNTWTGAVGDVITGAAQMAVSDMIMTSEREEVVDFTQPFMFDKLAILYVKQSWWETPPTSVEDFLTRNIKLGTYCCGSTFDFLKVTAFEMNAQMKFFF